MTSRVSTAKAALARSSLPKKSIARRRRAGQSQSGAAAPRSKTWRLNGHPPQTRSVLECGTEFRFGGTGVQQLTFWVRMRLARTHSKTLRAAQSPLCVRRSWSACAPAPLFCSALCAIALALAPNFAAAQEPVLSIENQVSGSNGPNHPTAPQSFSNGRKAHSSTTSASAASAVSGRVVQVSDNTFGLGQALEIVYPDGGHDMITLFPNLPFALFRRTLQCRRHRASQSRRRNPAVRRFGGN